MVFTMTNVTFYVKSTGKQLLFKIYEINVIISKLFVRLTTYAIKILFTRLTQRVISCIVITLGPLSLSINFTCKWFSLKPLGQLESNLLRMVIGWSSTKCLFLSETTTEANLFSVFVCEASIFQPIQIASTDLLQLLSFPITVRTKSGQHPNFFILFKSDLSWVFLMEKCLASVCLSVIRKSSHFQLLYNHCMSSHQTYHKCSFSRREESVWTPSKSKVDDMALDWWTQFWLLHADTLHVKSPDLLEMFLSDPEEVLLLFGAIRYRTWLHWLRKLIISAEVLHAKPPDFPEMFLKGSF